MQAMVLWKGSTMKSLLAILTDPLQTASHLTAAAAFARAHDAHLDVLAIGLDATPVSYGDFGATVAIIRDGITRAEEQALALASAAKTQLANEGPDLNWAVDTQIAQSVGLIDVVGRSARFADLVIQPQPYGPGRSLSAESVVEYLISPPVSEEQAVKAALPDFIGMGEGTGRSQAERIKRYGRGGSVA